MSGTTKVKLCFSVDADVAQSEKYSPETYVTIEVNHVVAGGLKS